MGSNIGVATVRSLLFFVLFLSLTCRAGDILAFNDKSARQSLKGLQGMNVVVENIGQDAIRDGLREDKIQTDVELNLRKVGMKVLSEEERRKTPGVPILYINVNAVLSSNSGLYGTNVNIGLYQDITLNRDSTITGIYAATWSYSTTGIVGKDNLRTMIRENINDIVDKFINAYLAVNPKN